MHRKKNSTYRSYGIWYNLYSWPSWVSGYTTEFSDVPSSSPLSTVNDVPYVTCWGRITAYFFGFWLFIPLLAIFLGRAFCGWLCPSGFVNQMLGKVAITKLKIRNKKMRWAQLGMVVTILIGLGVYFIYDNPRVMIPIRTSDEYFNSLIMSIRFADWYWAVRTVIVVALIAASLIISNFWCRFICPVGGAMELIRKISIFRIFKTDACDNCDACLRKCDMGTRPDEMNCTNCGDCLNVCHKNAIKFGRKGKQ